MNVEFYRLIKIILIDNAFYYIIGVFIPTKNKISSQSIPFGYFTKKMRSAGFTYLQNFRKIDEK